MRICMPIEDNKGLGSKIFNHFGSAPFFLVYNTVADDIKVVNNSNQNHVHGTCNPMQALDLKKIDAVVCCGMGLRAINKLNYSGIKTFISDARLVSGAIDQFKTGRLEELRPERACAEHGCH